MSRKRGKKKGGSIFDKLTDSTGSHKSRFNEDGTGRGAAGRDLGKMGGGSNSGWHGERFKASGGGGGGAPAKRRVVKKKKKKVTGTGTGTGGVRKKKKVVRKKKTAATTGAVKRKRKKKSGGSIFDRLTDASQYTGSHKNRFNADGTGRGAAGRDLGKSGGGTHSSYGW